MFIFVDVQAHPKTHTYAHSHVHLSLSQILCIYIYIVYKSVNHSGVCLSEKININSRHDAPPLAHKIANRGRAIQSSSHTHDHTSLRYSSTPPHCDTFSASVHFPLRCFQCGLVFHHEHGDGEHEACNDSDNNVTRVLHPRRKLAGVVHPLECHRSSATPLVIGVVSSFCEL